MPEMATYNIPKTQTARLTAAAVARGLRLTTASTGLCSVSNSLTVRGEHVALTAGAASGVVAVAPIQSGGSAPFISDGAGAIAVGDPIYCALAGKVSTTSTNATLLGRALTAAAATDGLLVVVQIESSL